MDLITVLTCPILRPDYLLGTLDALDDAGANECERKLVCSDGPGVPLACSWPYLMKADGPSGVRTAKWWVLRSALELGADRLIYCEDDIILAKDAIRRIRACKVPSTWSCISFYDYKETRALSMVGAKLRRIHPVPVMGVDGRGMWGSQCLLIPRRTIQWVLQRGPYAWGDPWPERSSCGDGVFSWALKDSPFPLRGIHIPSLVDHGGDRSSVNARHVRKAARFTGA